MVNPEETASAPQSSSDPPQAKAPLARQHITVTNRQLNITPFVIKRDPTNMVNRRDKWKKDTERFFSIYDLGLRKDRTFLKRSSLKSYYINVSTNSEHPGEFWKKFHCLLPSKDRGNSHIQLIEDGRLITDSIDVANLLNDYFIHAVPRPTHMSNLQPEECKTHSSVIAIEQKFKGQMSFSFTLFGIPTSRGYFLVSKLIKPPVLTESLHAY